VSRELLITMWLALPGAFGALQGTRRVGYGASSAVGTRLGGTWLTAVRASRRVANL
jgi:hypothetical protein